MGIIDIFKGHNKANSIEINEISKAYNWTPFIWAHKKGEKPVGNVYLQAILNVLWKGISNLSIVSTGKSSFTIEAITTFIEANATLLVNQYIKDGYITVFYDKEGKYRLPNINEIKKDINGNIINKYCVVIYSPQYQTDRNSLFKISLPIIIDINKIAGSEDYLNETLGCFGILSGKDFPMNPAEKEAMLKNMPDIYGIADDKFKYMITNNPVTYTPISPDISGLKFTDKITYNYKLLANLYGVPLPLLFDDKSTYNNVKEARIFFYTNTIRYYGELLLKIAKELLTASNNFIPKDSITYRITNVPEIDKTLSAACEERLKYLEYLKALKESGLDVEKQLFELQEESKKLFKEV